MRILVVYPYIPFPLDRGTYQRTFHLLRALAAENEVDLLALSENGERLEQMPVFEKFCRRVKFVPFRHPEWPRLFPDRLLHPLPTTIRHWLTREVAEAINTFIAGQKYDFVHVCDIVMAQYFLDEHRSLHLAIDRSRVDLQFQLAQRAACSRGWRQAVLDAENLAKLKRYEKAVARRAAVEVVCGQDDENFIRQHISPDVPVTVITNGVDLEYFNPRLSGVHRAPDPTILFCGAMDYTPNVDALRWYFGEIHEPLRRRIPALRVSIVGRDPAPEVCAYGRLPGVTVSGSVSDVRPYYRAAWLQIVPLRIGGGTRLKIPESMAMETPVISTTIGAQGLDLIHGDELLLADTSEDFVAETERALKDESLRDWLARQGGETVNRRLSWKSLGKELASFYANHFS